LSKAAGLPQLKLGWIVINGQGEIFHEAYNRLEFITDLFLSVSSPVQHALPTLLNLAPIIREQILQRVLSNYAWFKEQLNVESVCRLLPVEAGWYGILQVPKILTEEEYRALQKLEEEVYLKKPKNTLSNDIENSSCYSVIDEQEKKNTCSQ
jgi:aspartate/methionine/tyrosine aminotransferase